MSARRGLLYRLSALAVTKITKPGRHADGGNLFLVVSQTGAKRWAFIWMRQGRQREAGLGSLSSVSLAEARKKAADYRSLLSQGLDPIEHREGTRKAVVDRRTFAQCAVAFLKAKRSGWRNAKYAKQYVISLERHCHALRERPIEEIDTADVLAVLQPLWATTTETASRVRGRLELVLDFAKAQGWRVGENPARWKGHLENILPRRPKLARSHRAAMPYGELPAFIRRLRVQESIATKALEFLILTATRLGEVLGATWPEIDFEAAVWTIPATRMKAGHEHRVPLSSAAVAILKHAAECQSSEFIFVGRSRSRPVSGSALRKLMSANVTIHGCRSSFRDWAGNETNFPRELAEQSLAHRTGDTTELAYRRGDALEKRRALMTAWADFICQPVHSKPSTS
jgi:integrase